MNSYKHINKITVVLMSVALILCLLAMVFSDTLSGIFVGTDYNMEYASKLFDTSEIITMDIAMEQEQWDEMLENATSEEYYKCDVVINGTTFYSVGIRPKGNTSLSSVANDPDNNRYSFKLEFDQYVDGQNCWGLDKLALNNSYADSTNMKEAIIYDMYRYLDADAPLYNYAKISVNGEYWGVYLALESVEESFMVRNYGSENGHLYKPDSMNIGNREETFEMPEFDREDIEKFRENMMNFNRESSNTEEISAQPTEETPQFDRSQMDGMRGGGGPGGMAGNGSDLNYTDDNLDSYSAIWDGAVTGSTEADHKNVVTALKNISQGTNLEKYFDVDSALKYMAVHSFAVNDDSLSGNMAHNYYLYEANGKLNVIPWDYNLSFGGMRGGDTTGMINDPIDTPFSGTEFFDALLENEEYMEQYHEYYNRLVEEYIFGGTFDETYNRIRSQIDGLVETDPNYQYTYEEYVAGAEMLYKTVKLRGESIRGQLAGTIPSTSEGQQEDSTGLVDGSKIDTSVMGTFVGGGRGGMGGLGFNNQTENTEEQPQQPKIGDQGAMPQIPEGVPQGNMGERPNRRNMTQPENVTQQPAAEQPTEFQPETSPANPLEKWITPIISALSLIFGFIFVALYKRKQI